MPTGTTARRRHFAFLSYPAHGHVNPTLPVVTELVRRGHRVSYLIAGQYADAVRATGAETLVYRSQVPESWDTIAIPEIITADVVAEAARAHAVEGFSPLPVALRAFGSDRPDLLLYDAFGYPAGRLMSRKWDIPGVLLCTTFAATERYSPYARLSGQVPSPSPDHPALLEARTLVAKTLAEHGLPESPEEFSVGREKLNLVFVPRWFQPASELFDHRFAFFGPCLGPRPGSWSPSGDRPVLLITMGSFGYENQREFFACCLEAFADSPWQVIMTIGRLVAREELGPLPPNFEIYPWVPQLAVLRHASGFISHAGMGSTLEALASGVAPVVVPRSPEQELVADRVAELRLGRKLPPAEVSARSLRAAVNGLAADLATAERVRKVREAIAGARAPERAASAIEDLLT
jgi:MGT family glycosyltransferase